ncbi:MAG: hypothetical protein ACRDWG_04980 [Actinomycetes bacterium]
MELSSRDRRGPFPKRWLKRTGSPLPDADSEPEVRAWILEQIGPDDVERRNAVGVHASRRRALLIRRRDMS